jgi:TIR domain
MPIFISYSHRDADFVNRLAAQLVKKKARVWVDRWELNVGDFLLDRIQSALQSASALIVVLSKASTESEWCKKELSAGLLRELEERRVVVLPILIEDCEIPIFLRGKLYADFRKNFDAGIATILEAVACVTSEAQGRIERPEWHIDWAVDWGFVEESVFLRITMVEQAKDLWLAPRKLRRNEVESVA